MFLCILSENPVRDYFINRETEKKLSLFFKKHKRLLFSNFIEQFGSG
jgi:homoserine trans-succinylase